MEAGVEPEIAEACRIEQHDQRGQFSEIGQPVSETFKCKVNRGRGKFDVETGPSD